MNSRPLERDYWVILREPYELVAPWLNTPDRLSSWFHSMRREPAGQGHIKLLFPGAELQGSEEWILDPHALWFRSYDRNVEGWITIRSVILSGNPQVGTEIWIHVQIERTGQHQPLFESIDGVIRRGLKYIEQEICCA